MIDLDIVRIPDSPMKLVVKKKWDVLGCLYYGDHYYSREYWTEEMNSIYAKYHAATLKERIDNGPID